MSSSDGEWTKLATTISRIGEAHARDEKNWTDILALMGLRYEQDFHTFYKMKFLMEYQTYLVNTGKKVKATYHIFEGK